MQLSPISDRSLEQLEDELISFFKRMNGQEYEFLVLIREFDMPIVLTSRDISAGLFMRTAV